MYKLAYIVSTEGFTEEHSVASCLAAKHSNELILIGLEERFPPAEAQLILPTMVLNLSHIARQCGLSPTWR